jgi:hypothetical protein
VGGQSQYIRLFDELIIHKRLRPGVSGRRLFPSLTQGTVAPRFAQFSDIPSQSFLIIRKIKTFISSLASWSSQENPQGYETTQKDRSATFGVICQARYNLQLQLHTRTCKNKVLADCITLKLALRAFVPTGSAAQPNRGVGPVRTVACGNWPNVAVWARGWRFWPIALNIASKGG